MGEDNLRNSFPRLFLNSEQNMGLVSDMGNWNNGSWLWEVRWLRPWLEAEVTNGVCDSWRWIIGASQLFLVRVTYLTLHYERNRHKSLLMIYGKWYNIFGISSTLLQKARDHFYQNAHGMILSSKEHWWILGWSSIIWNVWYAWNKFIFENKFPNKEQIWQRCLFNTWSWMKAFKKDFMVSFQQWQVSPGVCLLNL
ncbi:hypothetical protein GmHk_18G051890 [Glycine max]|nr:hypothetical protein GmHk_18G051890 [Glycine max]